MVDKEDELEEHEESAAVSVTEMPTMRLRQVEVGGDMVLQQLWHVTEVNLEGMRSTEKSWRDVPVVDPEKKQDE